MGVASLVIGIISLIIGFIPLCGAIALVPAIIALILGIVSIVTGKKKNESIGVGIAGTIVSAIATLIIIFWVFIFGAAAASIDVNDLENSLTKLNEMYDSYYYNY